MCFRQMTSLGEIVHLYGDDVSFGTTFDTNRYKMIFAPFTGS